MTNNAATNIAAFIVGLSPKYLIRHIEQHFESSTNELIGRLRGRLVVFEVVSRVLR